jgi:DNA-binding MarR family transcriptional regulator
MPKSEWIESIRTTDDIVCTREHFITAARIFDNAEENISRAIEREEEKWGKDAKVARILRIIRGRASTHSIAQWTPTSSEQILQSLERSTSMQFQWIGKHVKSIIHGVINSTPDREITPIIQEIQQQTPNEEKLTVLNVRILSKIQLDECCVGDLIKYFKTEYANMSDTITEIGKKWYLEKNKKKWSDDDKRKVYLRLTPKWEKLIAQVQEKLQK